MIQYLKKSLLFHIFFIALVSVASLMTVEHKKNDIIPPEKNFLDVDISDIDMDDYLDEITATSVSDDDLIAIESKINAAETASKERKRVAEEELNGKLANLKKIDSDIAAAKKDSAKARKELKNIEYSVSKTAISSKEMTKQKKEKEDLEKIQEDLINKNKKQELANKKSQEEAAALQKQKVLLEKKIAALKKKPTINKKIRNSKNYTKEQIEIAQYKISIRDKVYQNWRKPKWAKKDWTCMASIVQNRFGRILKAEVHSCNYNHSSFRGSIETAISRSSPLPLPINDDFFEKNINITFIVN